MRPLPAAEAALAVTRNEKMQADAVKRLSAEGLLGRLGGLAHAEPKDARRKHREQRRRAKAARRGNRRR